MPYAILGNNNYRTVYEFLLKGQTLENGTGESNDILTQSVMNNIFGFGTIVNNDDRVLTVKIKVSELYTITLKAEEYENPSYGENIDPYYGDRTTTIKNHDTGFGNYTNSGTLTTSGSDFANSVVIYTYKGVENILSSTFNVIAYRGVNYRLGNSASNLEGNVFTLDETKVDHNGNIELIVTYIPNPITTLSVTYQLNGVENSSIVARFGSADITGKLIKELTSTSITGLYYGQYVNYGYELLNNDGYAVSVTLNGVVQTNNPFACVVNEQAFRSGGFYIIVNVISVEKENATVMYILQDNSTAFADDDYGDLELFVGGTPANNVTMMGNMYVVSVAEGKTLSVDISGLAKGYSFVSLNRSSTVLTTNLPGSRRKMSASFPVLYG